MQLAPVGPQLPASQWSSVHLAHRAVRRVAEHHAMLTESAQEITVCSNSEAQASQYLATAARELRLLSGPHRTTRPSGQSLKGQPDQTPFLRLKTSLTRKLVFLKKEGDLKISLILFCLEIFLWTLKVLLIKPWTGAVRAHRDRM